jgi:hypothetical protein
MPTQAQTQKMNADKEAAAAKQAEMAAKNIKDGVDQDESARVEADHKAQLANEKFRTQE